MAETIVIKTRLPHCGQSCIIIRIGDRVKSLIMTSRWPAALDESLSTIDLYESHKERKYYDCRANLYAIIMATEHLERAYAQDCVSNEEYTIECNKLISQFKIAEKALENETTESFMRTFQMDCPRAANRLLKMGVPESLRSSGGNDNDVVAVKKTTADLITAMDTVRLGQVEVDALSPVLLDLRNSLAQHPGTPKDWGPLRKVENWLVKLNSMRAYDSIDANDSRQLVFDLETAYEEFDQYLNTKGR